MIRIIVTFLLLSFLMSCNPIDDEEVNEISKRTYSWKMVTAWPPNSPINQESVEQFAKDVAIMSRGRLKIKVFAQADCHGKYTPSPPPHKLFLFRFLSVQNCSG